MKQTDEHEFYETLDIGQSGTIWVSYMTPYSEILQMQ